MYCLTCSIHSLVCDSKVPNSQFFVRLGTWVHVEGGQELLAEHTQGKKIHLRKMQELFISIDNQIRKI